MARFIQAVRAYGPRIEHGPTVRQRELEKRLALSTGLQRSQVLHVLLDLSDALQDYLATGRPVVLEGIGRFSISTDSEGQLRMNFRAHRDLRRELATLENFEGRVANRDNLGLTPHDLKALWDAEFPDDPLELPRLLADRAA